jgi:hypothetical protein
MAFKHRPCKVKYAKEYKTVDEMYKDTLLRFDEVNNLINKNLKKISVLNSKLNSETNKVNLEISKQISKLEKENELLHSRNDELEYFNMTKDVLIEYFESKNNEDIPDEIIETKEIINYSNKDSDNNYSNSVNFITNSIIEIIDTSKNLINNILNNNLETDSASIIDRLDKLNELNSKNMKIKKTPKKKRVPLKVEKKSILSFLSQDSSGNEAVKPITTMIHEKGKLKDQYLSLVDPSYRCDKVKVSPVKLCTTCLIEKTLIQSEGVFVCQQCGVAEHIIIESEVPSHKDAMNEKPKYPYNPINHLIEKLNQYQAKQTTIIPQAIYDIIKLELKKQMMDIADITPDIIQKILKKYRKNMYYEHHYLIFSHITGTPPPSLTREEEEQIKKMFKETEKPFKLFKPENRDNYLNYSYVLNKLFLILGDIKNDEDIKFRMYNNAQYFKLLKSRDKLRLQDMIWKNICKYLDWPFHSSF